MPPTHTKSGGTCWTCRLRRKKCDGARPVCGSCAALETTCHNGLEKPGWMDGAAEQKIIPETMKRQIKKRSGVRRETRGTTSNTFVVTLQQDYETATDTTDTTNSSAANSQPQAPSIHSPIPSSVGASASSTVSVLDLTQEHTLEPFNPSDPSSSKGWELDYVMIYLDYVFPFLFPFYQPPLVGTGRAWLLTFIRQNDAVFHSILSLSSYFLTIGLKNVVQGKHSFCKWTVWEQTLQQADLSFEMIHKELDEVSQRVTQHGLIEKARLMESIIQLLIFESFLSNSTNWDLHLKPAVTLFQNIIGESAEQSLPFALHTMAWPSRVTGFIDRPLWNTDQAAFRFFSAVLIYVDIVASTSVGREPLLKDHHAHLVTSDNAQDVSVAIHVSSFVGCQSWALLAVGKIASLSVWMKEMRRGGRLSVVELVERAKPISKSLEEGLAASYANSSARISGAITQIWAHAALIYLSTTISGWQPASDTIRQNVSAILELLSEVKSGAQLRALAWPICVAGCLALADDEQKFRELLADVGDQQALNTLREAGEVMQAVWENQDKTGHKTWDLEYCLQILGRPVLLI
ncbi:fungal-specific transcription factor domain-containing protein [Fusarium oxysporum Fo47]|uniref:fungal-specific transcription factor domain-containing protein n=1 Tax=Fusarium oxysporum Fo47 TaxID=660027 RepID=UPI002869D99E|nr:fungal-specific transcription factor domain-containing protein [Fusarium oxysporum Fo47]QKD57818.2 fungal-specific transcription factor domain-domain-containing protein [Fusarium oxysporum Fo47]